jgi:hypothetical protein
MILRFSKELKKEYADRMREVYPRYERMGATDDQLVRILKTACVLMLRAIVRSYIVRTKWFFLFMVRSSTDYNILSKTIRRRNNPRRRSRKDGVSISADSPS